VLAQIMESFAREQVEKEKEEIKEEEDEEKKDL